MNKRENRKQHILGAGLDLMRRHGYNGTSVKDIVDAAGVPKGSFYNYFESKEAFALEALDAVAEDEVRLAREILQAGPDSPLERLQYFFSQATQRMCDAKFREGCFFGNLAQEMSDSNDVIRRKAAEVLQRKAHMIARLLDEARAAGEIESDLSNDALAEFIFNAWEGTLIRMKASRDREPLDVFLQMLPRIAR